MWFTTTNEEYIELKTCVRMTPVPRTRRSFPICGRRFDQAQYAMEHKHRDRTFTGVSPYIGISDMKQKLDTARKFAAECEEQYYMDQITKA